MRRTRGTVVAFAMLVALAMVSPSSAQMPLGHPEVEVSACVPFQPLYDRAAAAGRRQVEIKGDDLVRFLINYNAQPPVSAIVADQAFAVIDSGNVIVAMVARGCVVKIDHATVEAFVDLLTKVPSAI